MQMTRAIVAILAALAATASHAAFTMKIGGGLAGILEAIGGVRGYSASAEVNGQPVEIAAAGFAERTPRAVAAEYAEALGLPQGAAALGEGLVADVGDSGEKLLLVPDGKGGTVAWTVSGAKNGAPRNADAKNGAPLSPLAEPVFTARNKASGATLSVGVAGGDPAALRESQGAHLVALGWEAVDLGGDSGLDLFVRDKGVCVVWAGFDEASGQSRLAVFCRGNGIQ